ncbi:CBS domain-containing protein [Prauserella oleivorans]|uniref:CBS domain-containing protein n=1 Tax=Prauserella oleivorans TaxID=1478153 RepID=A0ABW5WFF5_9PSEU
MSELTARDVMTPDPRSVTPETDLGTVARVLAAAEAGAVAVVDARGRPVGVVSEADLMCAWGGARHRARRTWLEWQRAKQRLRSAQDRRAGDVMTSPASTVDAATPVSRVARELEQRRLRWMFVVDDGVLAGVLSYRHVAGVPARPDDDIRHDIATDVFTRILWVEPDTVGIAVEHGVVTLLGQVESRSDAELAGRLARGVPGVAEVRNRLGYVWDDTPDGTRVKSGS